MSNATADRLNQISEELKNILEARLQELAVAMRSTEQVTRQIVSTELEVARYLQITADSAGELASLKREADEMRGRADEATINRNACIMDRDSARDQVAALEREARELGTQVTDLRVRQRTMELEAESLRGEAAEVAGRVKAAEENVLRLRRLREELFEQVSALSKSGSKE